MLKRNIVANLAGGIWIAGLTVAITPLQINLLGMEAYGLIGLIAMLQVMLGGLDLGLATTVTRVVAADRDGGREANAVLASVAAIYWGLAVVIALTLWQVAGWIAAKWLTAQVLSPATVTRGVQVIGLYLALRWPVAFYSGVLAGRQRMDLLNLIKAGTASLRLLGGILVLLATSDLLVFLSWMALTAFVEVGAFLTACRYVTRSSGPRAAPSFTALRGLWHVSAGTNLVALSAVVLTQLDRVVVSKFLSLEALGYYSLAGNIMVGISLIQMAINGAALPNLAGLGRDRLPERYEVTSNLIAYTVAFPCLAVVWFGRDILTLWVGSAAAEGAYAPAALLVAGLLFNALMSSASTACLAVGRPWPVVRVNVLATLLYVPVLLGLTWAGGLVGAASAWLVLNLYFFVVGVPALHRALDLPRPWPWMAQTLRGAPLLAAVVLGLAWAVAGILAVPLATWLALIAAAAVYGGISYRRLQLGNGSSAWRD